MPTPSRCVSIRQCDGGAARTDAALPPQRPLFDWYVGGEQLWPTLKPLLNAEQDILEIGCGNSPLAEYLWTQGLRRLQCVDFSVPCVEQMQKRAADLRMGITYRAMDVRALGYLDASFDVVLDKVRNMMIHLL